jgi:roadblock/LC7 domain-containing protein
MRLLAGWFCLLTALPLAAQLPAPPKGEYTCTQTQVVAGISLPGMPPTTTVQTMPSAFGNLILDGGNSYRMSLGKTEPSAYIFDAAAGRVVFAGFLQAFTNSYGTRGRNVYFDFRAQSISFSCGLTGTRDYGMNSGARAASPAATAAQTARPLTGRLYFATSEGIVRLDLASGAQTVLSSALEFDVRGNSLVLVNQQGQMILTNEDGVGAKPVPIYGGKNHAPRFSPDGRRISYLGEQKPTNLEAAMMGAYTSANQEPLVTTLDGRLVAALGTPYSQPAWTLDGRLVVAGAKALGSLAGNAATGIFLSDARLRSLKRIDPDFDAPHSPAVSPDGALVAFINGTRIWVMPLDGSGKPQKWFEGASKYLGGIAWSPDGRVLAFTENRAIRAVNSEGKPVPVEDKNGYGLQSSSTLFWLP